MQIPVRSTTQKSKETAITRVYQELIVNNLTINQIKHFIKLIDVDGITANAPDLGFELKGDLVLKASLN